MYSLSLALVGALLLHQCYSACVSTIPDTDRYFFVNNLNKFRELAAHGKLPNKCGTVPTGKNMYKLENDCALEEEANAYTSGCGAAPMGQNMIVRMYGGSNINVQNSIAQAFNDWILEGQTQGVPDDLVFNGQPYAWSNLMNGESTKVGCAYTLCDGSPKWLYVACKFDKPGYMTGATIYEPGTPCTADSECTTYRQSTCDTATGLCSPPAVDPDDGSSTKCANTQALTDYEREIILESHNNYRSSLALGKEFDKIIGGNAPKAKQMRKMTYDCDAELSAATWGANCLFNHSKPEQRPGMGENLYYTSDTTTKTLDSLTQAADAWWAELKDLGVGAANILTDEVSNRGVGHYTQMAWETTTGVGCASVVCPKMKYVVCQYKPGGNYGDQLIYTLGDPCTNDSGCPGAQTCSVAEGLCV